MRQGNYYVLTGEDEAEHHRVGIRGQRHLRWLKQNRRVTYTNLLTSGRLCDYRRDIEIQANQQLELQIRQMAETESITEQMKAGNQMEWVRRMNNIRVWAETLINNELIYC